MITLFLVLVTDLPLVGVVCYGLMDLATLAIGIKLGKAVEKKLNEKE
jgi:hypothetical protein